MLKLWAMLVEWRERRAKAKLRSEIEKRIGAKRRELERRDAKRAEFDQSQRKRFAPLRPMLEELVSAIDPTYLEAGIGDAKATIEIGRRDRSSISPDIRLEIEPASEITNDGVFRGKPGFRFREEQYHGPPDYGSSENEQTFASADDLMKHLLGVVADTVALYRHWGPSQKQD